MGQGRIDGIHPDPDLDTGLFYPLSNINRQGNNGGIARVRCIPMLYLACSTSGCTYLQNEHKGQLPPNCLLASPTNSFDKFSLTSFATNVPQNVTSRWGTNKTFLLAPLAALFCTPLLTVAPKIWAALPVGVVWIRACPTQALCLYCYINNNTHLISTVDRTQPHIRQVSRPIHVFK